MVNFAVQLVVLITMEPVLAMERWSVKQEPKEEIFDYGGTSSRDCDDEYLKKVKCEDSSENQDPESLADQGHKLCERNLLDEGIDKITRAINAVPRRGLFYRYRGMCYEKARMWDLAESDYRETMEISQIEMHGRELLGKMFYKRQMYTQAIEVLEWFEGYGIRADESIYLTLNMARRDLKKRAAGR